MNDDDSIFTSFDDFVQITDRAVAHGGRQWPIVPDGLLSFEQEAPDEVCRREVFVTGDGDQRAFQTPSHMLDKGRPPATRRPLKHNGQTGRVRRLERLDLARHRQIVSLGSDSVLFDGSLWHSLKSVSSSASGPRQPLPVTVAPG